MKHHHHHQCIYLICSEKIYVNEHLELRFFSTHVMKLLLKVIHKSSRTFRSYEGLSCRDVLKTNTFPLKNFNFLTNVACRSINCKSNNRTEMFQKK